MFVFVTLKYFFNSNLK